jgi:hypothetical protein
VRLFCWEWLACCLSLVGALLFLTRLTLTPMRLKFVWAITVRYQQKYSCLDIVYIVQVIYLGVRCGALAGTRSGHCCGGMQGGGCAAAPLTASMNGGAGSPPSME